MQYHIRYIAAIIHRRYHINHNVQPSKTTGIQKLETFINWKLLDLRQVQRYYMRLHTYNLSYYVLEVCM